MSTSEGIIRDPSEYTPSIHFTQRFKQKKRKLTGDVIRECITEGEATVDEKTGAIKYRSTVDGTRYCLVADPETREVCTAYPED